MFRIENIMQSNPTIDNIYDLVFLVYVGRYIKQELQQDPDYSSINVDPSMTCPDMMKNKNLIEFLKDSEVQGGLNTTLSFYRSIVELDINTDNLEENFANLVPYTGSIDMLGVKSDYKDMDFISELSKYAKNSQFQFIYISLVARLLVLRYISNNLQKSGYSEVFDSIISLQVRAELLYFKTSLVYLTHIINYPEVKSLIAIQDMEYINMYSTFLYYAWGYDQQTKGLMKSKGFTVEDKIKAIESNPKYENNLPVLLYTKKENYNATKDSYIETADLVIIRNYDEQYLFIEKTRITDTKVGRIAETNQNRIIKEINSIRINMDDLEYNPEYETFNLSNIGIGGTMMAGMRKNGKSKKAIKEDYIDSTFEEEEFIKELDATSNVRIFINPSNILNELDEDEVVNNRIEVVMTQVDAVYWLLKDWGVQFDEERYKELYKDSFEYEVPLYNMELPVLYKALQASDMEINQIASSVLSSIFDSKNG